MSLAKVDDFRDDGGMGLRGVAVGAAGEFVEAGLPELLVAADPLVGCLGGYVVAFGELSYLVEVELPVFNEALSRLVHSNTFPGHRSAPPLRKCYLCLENMCYRCLEKIPLPMSWSRSGDRLIAAAKRPRALLWLVGEHPV